MEGTIIGLAMWGVAALGIAQGWLGAWGYLLWVPLIVLGAAFFFLIGHWLLVLSLPVWLVQEALRRCKKPPQS